MDDRYVILLVGLSKKQIKKLPRKIQAIPRTNNRQELAEVYTAADIFVNPTYEDNYPTVNLEAEACGIPVITYDTGGSRETIHKDTSIVIPTGDVERITEQIKIHFLQLERSK